MMSQRQDEVVSRRPSLLDRPSLEEAPFVIIDPSRSQHTPHSNREPAFAISSQSKHLDSAPQLAADDSFLGSGSFFFDEFSSRDQTSFGSFFSGGADDEEDERDFSALQFTESIRMNLHALSSADQYPPLNGYQDPNLHYGTKLSELQEHRLIDDGYAHLISQLSIARGNDLDPDQLSSRHSTPFSQSDRSARSSSEDNGDELKTPPEPSDGEFTPTPEHPSAAPTQAGFQAESNGDFASRHGLRSAFASPSRQPQQPQPDQQRRPQPRPLSRTDLDNALSRYRITDDAEMEHLSEDVDFQRRAAGKGKMPAFEADIPLRQDARSSISHSLAGHASSEKPFSRLGPQDIAFKAANLPERDVKPEECVEVVTTQFPSLCDAPLREFGEDGEALPPTKKQETSPEEREARKAAMKVAFHGKQKLSLIKDMVVMESRSASWKRIGKAGELPPAEASSQAHQGQSSSSSKRSSMLSINPSQLTKLPEMPSAWSMEIRHSDLDAAQIQGKNKRTIELPSVRTNALCHKCEGNGLFSCVTCKGEQADECFWCSGTGREKARAKASCRRCQGAGILKCNTCEGKLKSACKTCEGSGCGQYGFFVDVKVKRIEMPSVPVSSLISSPHPQIEEVRAAATMALWDSIIKLTEAGASRSKPMVPVMAGCVWENSVSHIVSIDVPQQAKFKKGASPALRPEGLHRKIPTVTRYFTIPSDKDVRPVEIPASEVERMKKSSQLPQNVAVSTPSLVPSPRSEAVTPATREFVPRPSPLSQLVASPGNTPRSGTPQPSERSSHTDSYGYVPPQQANKPRRPSAGQILSKKLSSNLLMGKIHRGSF